MPLFRRRPPVEKMEQNIDDLRVQNEEAELQAQLEEKKAIIAELKRKYGPGWRRILGINDLSLANLRNFARTASVGLRSQAQSFGTSNTSGGMDLSHLRSGVNLDHLRQL